MRSLTGIVSLWQEIIIKRNKASVTCCSNQPVEFQTKESSVSSLNCGKEKGKKVNDWRVSLQDIWAISWRSPVSFPQIGDFVPCPRKLLYSAGVVERTCEPIIRYVNKEQKHSGIFYSPVVRVGVILAVVQRLQQRLFQRYCMWRVYGHYLLVS